MLRSISLPFLRLTPPTEGYCWDDLRKILHEDHRMVKVQNGENIAGSFNSLNDRYRRQTDDRRICDSVITFGLKLATFFRRSGVLITVFTM